MQRTCLRAVGIEWDKATPADGRDLVLWLRQATKPLSDARTASARTAGRINPIPPAVSRRPVRAEDHPALELGAAQLPRASAHGRDGPGLWALDLVVQPNGNWTFLELDAGGLFGFIDDGAGAPLTAQLADLLTKGKP